MKEFTVVPVFIKFSMTFIVSTMWNLYCARIVQLSSNFREKKIDGIELLTVGCGPGCSSLWLWPGPDLVWSYRWGVGGPWGPGARSRDQARAGAGVVWPRPWRVTGGREKRNRGHEDTGTTDQSQSAKRLERAEDWARDQWWVATVTPDSAEHQDSVSNGSDKVRGGQQTQRPVVRRLVAVTLSSECLAPCVPVC